MQGKILPLFKACLCPLQGRKKQALRAMAILEAVASLAPDVATAGRLLDALLPLLQLHRPSTK